MKIQKLLLALLSVIGSASAATVNIQISQGVNQATNFANFAGTQNNGLVWGLMISTGDNSFSEFIPGFHLSTLLTGTQIGNSDDYFIESPVLTAQGFAGDTPNPGRITILNSIQMNVPATNPIVTGNQFAIVWFDSNVTGATQSLAPYTWYGIMTDPTWTIPAAGTTQNISSFFATSPDPEKRADDVLITPEPSSALLGFVSLSFLLRRRRSA